MSMSERERSAFLKLADSFSGMLPAAGVADRLTGGNGVQAHEFSVERIERGCGVAVDVQRADELLLLLIQAGDQQRNRHGVFPLNESNWF